VAQRRPQQPGQRARLHLGVPENWRDLGPRRAFGVFDCATGRLIGSVEANLGFRLEPGQVNVSYGVFPERRGRGIAVRALELMSEYLWEAADAVEMVLRIQPANAARVRVAIGGAYPDRMWSASG